MTSVVGRVIGILPLNALVGAAGNGGTDCVKIIIWTKSRLGL